MMGRTWRLIMWGMTLFKLLFPIFKINYGMSETLSRLDVGKLKVDIKLYGVLNENLNILGEDPFTF